MPSIQKEQILYCIRDVIAVCTLTYFTKNYLISTSSTPFRYAIIIIISLSLIYCSFKCFSALINAILKLVTINSQFQRHAIITQYSIQSIAKILYFFIYLYLVSINIDALEEFNKIDFYLLIFKVVTL